MGGWRGLFTLVRRIRREISSRFAGRELAFNIGQVFQLARRKIELRLKVLMLLAKRIQIAIGRLLQFAVALAFFGELEL